MQSVSSLVKEYPLTAFFVLACAISWILILLYPLHILFLLLAAMGPGVAALIVTYLTDGQDKALELLRRAMPHDDQQTYLIAIGLPFIAFLVAEVVRFLLTGIPPTINLLTDLPVLALLVVFVVGEEIGWRGFALPILRQRHGDIIASLVLGGAWAFWRIANSSIPGLEYYVSDLPALLFYGIAISFWFTWLAEQTEGSIWMAWVFHGAINLWGTLLFIGDEPQQWWFAGAVFAIAALLLLRLNSAGTKAHTPPPTPPPTRPRAMPLKNPTKRP